jgi:hypothetical protein
MKRSPAVVTAIVLIHLVVAYVHGDAHEQLGVGLAPWQNAYVYGVIVAAPLVAAALAWTRWQRAGLLVLGISMLGALVFGVYFHFIGISNDHVSHLPEGNARGLFVATAILLVPLEAAGSAFGFWGWNKLRPAVMPTAEPK